MLPTLHLLTDLSVTGYEIHPADGYDGEQGGGYPTPTGARDEYTYKVSGKESITKIIPVDKPLPNQPQNPYNPNANGDNNSQGQPENNSGDGDRNHDLAGSDNPNMPNGSPDGGNDALADNGELKTEQPITAWHSMWLWICPHFPKLTPAATQV